ALVRRFTYSFLANPLGRLLTRGSPNIPPGLSQVVREQTEDLVNSFSNAYEMTCLSLPGRALQPLETWEARMPMLLVNGKKREVADVQVLCTYEGRRGAGAFVRLVGEVRGRGAAAAEVHGRVEGHALIDLDNGFVSVLKIAVRSESERGEVFATNSMEVALTRVPGNPDKITPPPPELVVKGTEIF